MTEKNIISVAKAICLALLVVALSFSFGCKKSPEPSAPATPSAEKQTGSDANAAPAVIQPAAEPNAEVNAPQADAAPTVEMAPLDIQLPKAMYTGTPQDLSRIPNVRPVSKAPRPPFLAPVGTELLSAGKPVTASDMEPIIGEISYITNGDKEAADGYYVELGPGRQDVTIDLGQEAHIYAIVVWHYHKQACVVNDVVVQIAKDKDFIEDVKTVFNNDNDNSSGLGIGKDAPYVETNEGELIDCLSQGSPVGRYVRLYSNGTSSTDMNYYIEVEVYGKPVE
jgi:hypothetical protein